MTSHELHRYVLLRQLAVLKSQEANNKLKWEIMLLEREKLQWKREKREKVRMNLECLCTVIWKLYRIGIYIEFVTLLKFLFSYILYVEVKDMMERHALICTALLQDDPLCMLYGFEIQTKLLSAYTARTASFPTMFKTYYDILQNLFPQLLTKNHSILD